MQRRVNVVVGCSDSGWRRTVVMALQTHQWLILIPRFRLAAAHAIKVASDRQEMLARMVLMVKMAIQVHLVKMVPMVK
jgi:hypothetical protein